MILAWVMISGAHKYLTGDMSTTPQHPDAMDQQSEFSSSALPDSGTLSTDAATGPESPAAPEEGADHNSFLDPPATAGPITRALVKGVCRKRSFKRQAPPPPSLPSSSVVPSVAVSTTSSDEAMSSGTETGGGPPTPQRSKASREAMMKLQGLTYARPPRADTRLATPAPSDLSDYEYVGYYGTPEVNYYPFTAFPGSSPPFSPPPLSPGSQGPIFGGNSSYSPPWGRGGGGPGGGGGLIHSASEGSVVPYHRRPGPLVPLPEETTAADGVLVASHPISPSPEYTRAVSPTFSQATQAYLNNDCRRRLDRSDSVVTVAHLCEDLYIVSPRFRVTLTNLTAMVVVAALALPNTAALLYTFFRLVFGTLFPAYYSYKAVKTKNVKEYVKWMMYWIVFAFFTCFETITDLFMAFWFPFYYELKILLVLWLLSPATRGSSVLYRKFVHPWLTQREEEIDECIARAKQQGYSTVLQLGTKGVNYATSVIMQTAIKGGGGLVNQLKRSYSVGELAEDQMDARTGDHNSNVKALPPGHDMGDYRHHPPTHAERVGTGISRSTSSASVSHGSRRVPGASSATRSSKTRSVDATDLYHSTHDLSLGSSADEMGGSNMSSSVPAPGPSATVRRRSPKIQQDGSGGAGPVMAVPGATSYRKSKTGEVSAYATLPRGAGFSATKRASTKKRQV